ncbi:MAG TPA: DUF5615 family PIN-like protein [Patescibacteria group bacterium]|nr:DUF5615 family PIN-like protein [Patescibacteria group bacterium]
MSRKPDNLHFVFAHHARRPFRILLDENVSPKVRDAIPASFAQTLLMKDAGLKGRNDREMWEWAAANGIDAILTHDSHMTKSKDLTLIAVETMGRTINDSDYDTAAMNRLPLVIHLEKKNDPTGDLKRIMDLWQDKLTGIMDNIRKSGISYIHVSQRGIKPGRSWFEIAFEEADRQSRSHTRAEQFEKKWLRKILRRASGEFNQEAKLILQSKLHQAANDCAPPVTTTRNGPSSQPS